MNWKRITPVLIASLYFCVSGIFTPAQKQTGIQICPQRWPLTSEANTR